MEYTIFANHAHVCPAEVRPQGTVPALKQLMKTCGIAKAVCFAPFRQRLLEEGLTYNQNDWLADEIAGDDALVGFGTVDFEAGKLQEQVSHIASLGLRGIKLHPAAQEFSVVGEQAYAVYEAAQDLGLFLSFHTGIHWHRISDYQPLLFDDIAWDFPALRFSMEHIGGYHFFREALAVICNHRELPYQVYAGWTSIFDRSADGIPGGWTLSDEELCTVIKQSGEFRSIFGLDFPFKREDYILDSIACIEKLAITETAKEQIFGKTLADLLDIEL